jgi:glycosyltransferase involved in cell wall biosynthesis
LLTARLARTTKTWRRVPLTIEARALRRLERRAAPSFDLVGVVSNPDRAALRDVVDHPHVVVVPNAYDGPPEGLPPATSPTACFVGLLSWAPNADAAIAFTQHVWPLVRRSVPGATLLLVGRDPTPAVKALASTDVIVTGTVADLGPWYARSRVALAPLLAGGGSRLKILEALTRARPVVATTVGAEGLEDLVGRGVVLADQPDAMARVLTELLLDPDTSNALGEQGARAVRDHHSWSAASSGLVKEIEVLLDKR